MDRTEEIKVLNDLIEVTIDSANGYEEAAERVKDSALKAMFERRAAERRAIVDDLQAHVRQHGEAPEQSGSFAAAAHRRFLDLKSLVVDDRKAVIEEVERGEDVIKERYEDALRRNLPAHIIDVVRAHYATIRADHDQMSALKHAAA